MLFLLFCLMLASQRVPVLAEVDESIFDKEEPRNTAHDFPPDDNVDITPGYNQNDIKESVNENPVDKNENSIDENINIDESNEVNEDEKEESSKSIGEVSDVTGGDRTDDSSDYMFSFLKPLIEELKEGLGNLDQKPTNITNADNMSLSLLSVRTEDGTVNLDAEKNETDTGKKVKFVCKGRNSTENDTNMVHITNGTELLHRLTFDKNQSMTDCLLVMFFAPWCQYCAKTAPSFNALARALTSLDLLAVDATQFSSLNARFGTVSVPNILLFHQSRAVIRYNISDRSLSSMVSFFSNYTGLSPNLSVSVEDFDFVGPVPSGIEDKIDYYLWFSWIFVIIFSSYMFINSAYGQQCWNKVRILWQEHQHIE